MNLIDLFERSSPYDRFNHAAYKDPSSVEFFSTLVKDDDGDPTGDFPSLAIYALDGPKKTAKKFLVYSFDRETSLQMYGTDPVFRAAMNAFRGGLVKVMRNKFPEFVSSYYVTSRSDLFRLLTTEFAMPSEFWGHVGLGKLPSIRTGFERFGNTRVFFRSEATPEEKLQNIELLRVLTVTFRKHGAGEVLSGDIRFTQLGGAHGLYNVTTNDIMIQSDVKADSDVIYTLAHEFGHKLMFKFMDRSIHTLLKHAFDILQKRKITYADTSPLDIVIAKLTKQLETIDINTPVKYVGSKDHPALKKDLKVLIIDEGNVYIGIDWDTKFSGPVNLLMNGDWEIEGMELNANEIARKISRKTAEWFQTGYSAKDYIEWWAEMFAHFILDDLDGEPYKFVKKILSER